MSTITEFIAARLDEDEAHARSTAERIEQMSRGGAFSSSGPMTGNSVTIHTVWMPERVCREVAAKRAHLALWLDAIEKMDTMLADDEADPVERAVAIGRAQAAREVVLFDAAVWSDHPDYLPEWAPEAADVY